MTQGARRVLLVLNPKSARAPEDPQELVAKLEARGFAVRLEVPEDPAQIVSRVREHAGGVELVVVGGGDGAIHTALPALLETRRPLAVLPFGNANDLARSLALERLDDVLDGIARDERRRVDVGRVDGRSFLNVALVGLGSEVARRMDPAAKRRFGLASYLPRLLEAVRAMRPFTARIRGEGGSERIRCQQIAVANGRHHGGGLTASQDASLSSGALVLPAIRAAPLWRILLLLPALRRGRHSRHAEGVERHGPWFEVCTHRALRVSADGEPCGSTPARFDILPAALEVVAPRDRSGDPAQRPNGGPFSLLRDERQIALNDCIEKLEEVARFHRRAAERLEEGDLHSLLGQLARERHEMASQLSERIRELGELPAAPDPDREAVRALGKRAAAALAADEVRATLEDRENDEQALAEQLERACTETELGADLDALLRRMAGQVRSARTRLATARAHS